MPSIQVTVFVSGVSFSVLKSVTQLLTANHNTMLGRLRQFNALGFELSRKFLKVLDFESDVVDRAALADPLGHID